MDLLGIYVVENAETLVTEVTASKEEEHNSYCEVSNVNLVGSKEESEEGGNHRQEDFFAESDELLSEFALCVLTGVCGMSLAVHKRRLCLS